MVYLGGKFVDKDVWIELLSKRMILKLLILCLLIGP